MKDYSTIGELILISNLKGSFRFVADLCTEISLPVRLDFITITAYQGEIKPSGSLKVKRDLQLDIRNKDVLLIEDIVDTGATVKHIINYLKIFKKAHSVKVCALLDKTAARKEDVPIHYRGFIVPDLFLVGYGLDYKEYFRELNRIVEYRIDKNKEMCFEK